MEADESLLEIVRRVRSEAARREADELEEGKTKLGMQGHTIEWGKDVPVVCTPVRITTPSGEVTTGTVCFDRSRSPRRRCDFCHNNWSVAQCDYPTGGPCKQCKGKKTRGGGKCHSCAATGYQMCNRRVCASCRAHRDPDEDYCPDHRERAGFPPLIKREKCYWTNKADGVLRRDCLHQGCEAAISYGNRVLYFPLRRRAMCEACGGRYIEVSQA